MGDSKGPQNENKNQTSKAGDTKVNNGNNNGGSNDDNSKAGNKAGGAADAKKKESTKLRDLGKLMYGCQSFGN